MIHVEFAYINYSTNDINVVIIVVTIAIEFYGNTKVITVYLDN